MEQQVAKSREFWDQHARQDPMWAVLSDPAKKGRKWDLREFMANGEREIALLWHQLTQLELVPDRGAALDFGCGIGRLTQALARRFDRVVGVDISPAMIAVAQDINRYEGSAEYVCNVGPDLQSLSSNTCDFIYSNIVLQHVEPWLSTKYLEEFFRLLKPNGVLVFQLPSHQEPVSDVTIRPMMNEAYQARVELTAPVPAAFAESELLATVRITNTSQHEWRQRGHGSIRAGNHWFDATGRFIVIQDDGREVLPQIIKPGESCDIVLRMVTPSTPGSYQCEIDLVHEGVTWFCDKGSRPLRFEVEVGGRPIAAAGRQSTTIVEFPIPDYPRAPTLSLEGVTSTERDMESFPMFGVPRAEVVEIIERYGGTLSHVEDGLRAGVEWVDYRYFVRASSAGSDR